MKTKNELTKAIKERYIKASKKMYYQTRNSFKIQIPLNAGEWKDTEPGYAETLLIVHSLR